MSVVFNFLLFLFASFEEGKAHTHNTNKQTTIKTKF